MDKLKPCPFCGDKPDMRNTEPSTLGMNEGAVHFAISCSGYHCQAMPSMDLWHISPEEATEAWNTRHIDPAIKAQIEAAVLRRVAGKWYDGLVSEIQAQALEDNERILRAVFGSRQWIDPEDMLSRILSESRKLRQQAKGE